MYGNTRVLSAVFMLHPSHVENVHVPDLEVTNHPISTGPHKGARKMYVPPLIHALIPH